MPTQELVENVAALNPMLALRYFRLVTASEHFRIATDTKEIHHLYSLLASWRERTCTSTSAKASIKDRARAADLSPFAVARALRGSPRVREYPSTRNARTLSMPGGLHGNPKRHCRGSRWGARHLRKR